MTLNYKKVNKIKTPKVLVGLPEELKDPACYKAIEKKLAMVMLSDHGHATVKGFVKCKRCQTKHHKRREMIREFGFVSVDQYMTWKKIMQYIVFEKPITVSNQYVI